MSEHRYWLAATYLPSLGPVRLARWVRQFESIENLWTASSTDLYAAGLKAQEVSAILNFNWRAVDQDLEWVHKNNARMLTQTDADYPLFLKEIPASPTVLFVQGDSSLLSLPQLAMVGSRNPSAMGKETATQFASCLAQAGLVITSGMALGVDAASHRGALSATGKTIAVVGSGLNTIYPASHSKLSQEIIENGALVSEFTPYTPPKAYHFPLRNRIISGLSLGVLVVEAALKSGSLITARYAVEQNREVFALPGSIHNPLARGCHQLIQQGAKLVETAKDILEELQIVQHVSVKKDRRNPPSFLKYIGWEPTSFDTIMLRSGLTAGEVCSMLLLLELEGYVQEGLGGYTRLID